MNIKEAKEALYSMATPDFTKELAAMIKSKQPIIYLVSSEEKRVTEYFQNYAIAGGYRIYAWDSYNGIVNIANSKPVSTLTYNSPESILDFIIKNQQSDDNALKEILSEDKDFGLTKANIFILFDFHRYLENCTVDIERRLKHITTLNENNIIVIVSPYYVSTSSLDSEMRMIEFPYPNNDEINKVLNLIVDSVSDKLVNLPKEVESKREEIINSVKGLTDNELRSALSKTICMHRKIDIPTVLKEKQEIIKKTGILEYFNSDVSIDDIGGLENLKKFLKNRKTIFTTEAKDYGLSTPKGILIIGVPGGGKSMTAKAAASLLEMPLLRLDFGALFRSRVGESEETVRRAIKIAEQVSPAILWIDEIEKGLSGGASSGETDGGTTSRVISTILTWMQEKKAPVFLVCTANDYTSIPPEFMRAGRFDEIFFVDIPNIQERKMIFEKIIKRKNRNPLDFDLPILSFKSEGYTGAEIEKAVNNGLLTSYQDKQRNLNTDDILEALASFSPLSVLRKEYIDKIRAWAKDKCVLANISDVPVVTLSGSKKIDVGENNETSL
jgi:SpoVK/Ycf46/Vps4 family AAA+-type ATPase